MKKFYTILASLAILSATATAQEAAYENPIGLRYIGTIAGNLEEGDPTPVAHYATRNPMNEGAFYWIPVEKTLQFTNSSTGNPATLQWQAEGGTIADPSARKVLIKYNDTGTYSFPKLTAKYSDASEKTYQPELKLKVGGRAELCLADTREWLTTYALGVNVYPQGMGCLGGANKFNVAGVGNFYMLSLEEGFLDGVNVYLQRKPTKYPAGAALRIRVWMVGMTDTSIEFTSVPLDGGYVKYDDIKTSDDGVWVPNQGGAVAHLEMSNPIDLYGKQLLFIDVDGWGDDPEEDDLQMLMDVMPNVQMKPEDASNLLAHNSFARLEGESDYLRPVSYYGGNYGSFMICPVVRGGETPYSGVENVAVDASRKLECTVSAEGVTFEGANGTLTIFNTSGMVCHSARMAEGSLTIPSGTLTAGIYIARDSAGNSVKFAVK